MLDWLKRAKRCDTEIARRRRWDSRCGRFAVVESNSEHFGRWYQAVEVWTTGELLLKRSRSRRVAERACEERVKA